MEMCYDGALVMPCNYAVMNEEEMTYVEGGRVSLAMKRNYLNKTKCKNKAASLIKNKKVKGMTQLAIAQEIFAHAQLYYRAAFVKYAGISNSVINEIARRAAVIDIDDNGDKWYRVVAYSTIWYGNPSI